jgi:hypothetical protein
MIVEISTGFYILKSCGGGKLKFFSRAGYRNVGVGKTNLHCSGYCVTLSGWAMSCLRRLVADQLLNRPSFKVWPVDVGFVEDRVALGQVFLWIIKILPVIVPLMFHTHSFVTNAISSRQLKVSLNKTLKCSSALILNRWRQCCLFWQRKVAALPNVKQDNVKTF